MELTERAEDCVNEHETPKESDLDSGETSTACKASVPSDSANRVNRRRKRTIARRLAGGGSWVWLSVVMAWACQKPVSSPGQSSQGSNAGMRSSASGSDTAGATFAVAETVPVARASPTRASTRFPALLLPPRPLEPRSPTRACRHNADCALLPDSCEHCPPCAATWRTAVNRDEARRLEAQRGGHPCPPISCPDCNPTPSPPGQPPPATGYVGERAVCEDGQCVAE